MICQCKLCGIELWLAYHTTCPNCPEYQIWSVWDSGASISHEELRVKNASLTFAWHRQQAELWFDREGQWRSQESFTMTELTPEMAKQWLKRLKTYVIFS